MDKSTLNKQLDNIKKMTQESKRLNAIFENTINDALKNAPESDKLEVVKLQELSRKAFRLAKEGKVSEAVELTKSYNNGR